MILSSGEYLFNWPLDKHIITSGYYRHGNLKGQYHGGLDLRASMSTPVYAAEDGEVDDVDKKGSRTTYGVFIKLYHGKYKGGGLVTIYAHLSQVLVSKGDKVSKGQLIGLSGNTGASTAPHLHFEIRYCAHKSNPLVWLDNDFEKAYPEVYTYGVNEHAVEVDREQPQATNVGGELFKVFTVATSGKDTENLSAYLLERDIPFTTTAYHTFDEFASAINSRITAFNDDKIVTKG